MNEIIRIHMAKLPFNIEKEAKLTLEKYQKALEAYLNDTDVYADIEQRMVEILEERGIKVDGVISSADVAAIIEQLGQPEAFLDESDAQPVVSGGKRLFRDPSTGLVGGVASGLSAYLGISVIWIRLIIVGLALASFGSVVFLYVLMWIIIPPVKTAADKLQLEGKPVTIPGIRQISATFGSLANTRDTKAIRLITFLLGLGLSMAALSALAASVVGAGAFLFHDSFKEGFYGIAGHGLMYSLAGLFVVSGVMLASLLTTWAYAAFSQRLTRKIGVISIVTVVVGLVCFGSGMGLMYTVARQQDHYMTQHTTKTVVAVTGDLDTANQLVVDASGLSVRYIVAKGPAKATLTAFSDKDHVRPNPQLTVVNGVVKVTLKESLHDCRVMFCGPYELTIAGPVLQQVEIKHGSTDYATDSQASLQVKVADDQSLTLSDGIVANVALTVANNATVEAAGVSIDKVTLVNNGTTSTSFGNVKDMVITNSQSCPAYMYSTVDLNGVSGSLSVNGVAMTATSTQQPCLHIELLQID